MAAIAQSYDEFKSNIITFVQLSNYGGACQNKDNSCSNTM